MFRQDTPVMEVLTQAAEDADKQIVAPLLQFRNWGEQIPAHWSTISNGAAFGLDYFTRTAAAKSNIFVDAPEENFSLYLRAYWPKDEILSGKWTPPPVVRAAK